MEELIKDIASETNWEKEPKNRFNSIVDGNLNKIIGLKVYTKNQDKILRILSMLREIVTGVDEYDKKTDEEANEKEGEEPDGKTDEQPDTEDVPDLESEESTEQRRIKEEKDYKY